MRKALLAITLAGAIACAMAISACERRDINNADDPGKDPGPGVDVANGTTAPDAGHGNTGGNNAAPGNSGPCAGVEVSGGLREVPAPPGMDPAGGDMLVRRLDSEPATLNPVISTDVASTEIQYYTTESLIDMDIETGELKPALAESWDVADDKVTFTFHLRKDVVWHDGEPFTADDVIYTLDRVMDPTVDAALIRSYFVDCESYEKIGDHTLRVKWKKPYFKALTMAGGLAVVPKHILDDGSDFNKHPFARKPVGTGPYKLIEWDTGQKIVLERNDAYWGEKPHFDRITFKILTNDDVSLQLLKKGELDLIARLNRVQWTRQTSGKKFKEQANKIYYDYPSYSYIGWNMRSPLFEDARVRRAMTMLLNRELMLKEIFFCLGAVSNGPFYYKTPYAAPEVEAIPYDPDKARALLAEAGWTDTNGDGVLDKDGRDFKFELSFTADVPEWEQMAVIYKEDLKKAGIRMEIRKLEWAVFAENVAKWKFDAAALAWALDANPDPYQLWHSSQAEIEGSSNHVGYKNAEVDRLIEANRAEFDRAKRVEYCRQIHRIIHADQPYTFFLTGQRLTAVQKRIVNIHPAPIRPCLNFNEWFVPRDKHKHTKF